MDAPAVHLEGTPALWRWGASGAVVALLLPLAAAVAGVFLPKPPASVFGPFNGLVWLALWAVATATVQALVQRSEARELVALEALLARPDAPADTLRALERMYRRLFSLKVAAAIRQHPNFPHTPQR